ncbi:MAG: hypothetical protein QNJ18_12325 [Xenococcaceae cyanobacterium MO_167.B52]|nr:hypothetical protein [Xenococcaceae cyanobacterium MO_167.B52]
MFLKQQRQLTAKAKQGKLENQDLKLLRELETTLTNLQKLLQEIKEQNDWKNCNF